MQICLGVVVVALFATRFEQAGASDCTEFGEAAKYNETLQQCVIPFVGRCDAVKDTSGSYRCGSGVGGVCNADGYCACQSADYPLFPNDPERNVSWRERFDYTCSPRPTLGQACSDDFPIGDTCLGSFECQNRTCICDGDWIETDHGNECRNDKFCSGGGNFGLYDRDAFYEKATGLCKCKVGARCETDQNGDPSLCPLNATMQAGYPGSGSGQGSSCFCDDELVFAGPHDQWRTDGSTDYACIPRTGKPGKPCKGWGQGTCVPGLQCSTDDDAPRMCTCNGLWDETTSVCYSEQNCKDQLVKSKVWPWRVFHENGSAECTCVLGAPCPWPKTGLGNDGQPLRIKVSCPAGSSLRDATESDVTLCVCDGDLVHRDEGKACGPKSHYGESCETLYYGKREVFGSALSYGDLEVNPCLNGSVCSREKCQCAGRAPFDPDRGRCLLRLYDACSENNPEDLCIPRAECRNGNCECQSGYYGELSDQNIGWTCRREGELGAKCESNDNCKNFTTCVGTRDPNYQGDKGRNASCAG